MASKKQYYGLDEIGFVGTQGERSDSQAKKDIEMTVRYIKAKKSGKTPSAPRKKSKSLVKVK